MNDNAGKTSVSQKLDYIEFTVGNTAGGSPIDITQMLVTFVCGETSQVIPFDKEGSIKKIGGSEGVSGDGLTITSGQWGVVNTYNDVGDKAAPENRNKLLEPGEQFVLRIVFPTDGAQLTPNTRFSVNLQPAIGAAFPIKKTVPSNLDEVNTI